MYKTFVMYLAIPHKGKPIPVVRLTSEEYDSIKSDSEKIHEYIYYKRRLEEIQYNKESFFESKDKYLDVFKAADNHSVDYDYQEEAFVNLNRCANNFVASFVSLTEHCEEKVKKLFGKTSAEKELFKKYDSGLYDSYFSYRFLKRMRNYAIHASHPIEFVSFVKDTKNSQNEFNIEVLCSKAKLLTSETTRQKIGSDLEKLNDTFEISPFIEEVSILIVGVLAEFIKIAKRDFIDSAERLVKLSTTHNQKCLSITKDTSIELETNHESKILPINISFELIQMTQ